MKTSEAASAPKPESATQRPPLQKKERLTELVAFEYGREIMDAMQATHGSLCKLLEVLCTELGDT